jgi:hypothetical protein
MFRCACCAVASYLGFGTLCGSLGAQCFIFSAPVPAQVRTNTQTYRETYQSSEALKVMQKRGRPIPRNSRTETYRKSCTDTRFGSSGVNVSFLVPLYPSKFGLIHKHTVKHTVKHAMKHAVKHAVNITCWPESFGSGSLETYGGNTS